MEKRFGFRCHNDDCSISVFTLTSDKIIVKYLREFGRDHMMIEGRCPVCDKVSYQTFDALYRERFDAMLEDIFRDIDPNLPEGV